MISIVFVALLALFLGAPVAGPAWAVVVNTEITHQGEPLPDATITLETTEGEPIEIAKRKEKPETSIDKKASKPAPGEILGLTKEFTDDPVLPGGTATLEFTITNTGPDDAVTGIAFTDDLQAVLPGLAATGLPLSNVCGAGSEIAGTSSLTFTGGNLAGDASCAFSVIVEVPPDTIGTYTNTTSPITGTFGGDPVTGAPATDDLDVGVDKPATVSEVNTDENGRATFVVPDKYEDKPLVVIIKRDGKVVRRETFTPTGDTYHLTVDVPHTEDPPQQPIAAGDNIYGPDEGLGASSIFYVEAGLDLKFVSLDANANVVFDRLTGGDDAASLGSSDTFLGAGGDVRVGVNAGGGTSCFGSFWAMPGDKRLVFSRADFAPGDRVDVTATYTPNSYTGAVGCEQVIFTSPEGTIFSVGAFAGVRRGTVDLTVEAEGPAGSVARVTEKHTTTSPVVGVEGTVRQSLQGGPGGLYGFVRGGAQLQLSDSVKTNAVTAGADSTVTFDTGNSTHFYVMFGIGIPLSTVSDARLKRDIKRLTTLKNGVELYSFKYLWDDTVNVGVMAQDLLADDIFKDSVTLMPNGFYAVDYRSLGIKMTTMDLWNARGVTAVML